uniref:HAD family hydrolase n=1 Tax=Parabacteroides distasonis TaxID=823 RepID=UPI004025CB48
MNKIKNIIFDFGGVLIDWNPRYLYNKYFDTEEQTEYFLQHICTSTWNAQMDAGKPFSEAIDELSAEYPEYVEAINIYHTRWIEMIGGEIDGASELIDDLKTEGFHIYGLTNWAAETLDLCKKQYQFFDKLDGMVVSSEVRMIKPDPGIYKILLSRYSLLPENSIFIDDSLCNISGAESVGIKAIHFENMSQLRTAIENVTGYKLTK